MTEGFTPCIFMIIKEKKETLCYGSNGDSHRACNALALDMSKALPLVRHEGC